MKTIKARGSVETRLTVDSPLDVLATALIDLDLKRADGTQFEHVTVSLRHLGFEAALLFRGRTKAREFVAQLGAAIENAIGDAEKVANERHRQGLERIMSGDVAK